MDTGEKKRQHRLKQQPQNTPSDEVNSTLSTESIEDIVDIGINCGSGELDSGVFDGSDNTWPAPVDMSIMPLLLSSDIDSSLVQNDGEWASFPSPFSSTEGTLPLGLFAASSNTSSPPPSFGHSPGSVNSDGSLSDSYHLPVFELTLLKGIMRIAERLGSPDDIWSLTAQSLFTKGTATPADQLPTTWQPTATQILTPHHPFLDFLPWPSVRDRVINIFALPERARPPSAAGPMGLVNLAYDIEDNSEGVRIYGEDPYDPAYWEVGQVVFQRWWFLFDRDIIATSNRWRRLRGAPPLALEAAEES